MKNFLKEVYFRFFKRKLKRSFYLYRSSDEDDKFKHLLECINYLRVAGDGGKLLPQTYFEFGCHSGRTFSAAINATKFLKMRDFACYAFDSFQGLPKTTEADGYFEEGTFYTSESSFRSIVRRTTGVNLATQNVIKGFYSQSLTEGLSNELPKIGVLHIDVDLYSSTVEVLDFSKDLLVNGSVILFDDYYCYSPNPPAGELRALEEFLERNPSYRVIPWKAYSTFGQSFFVSKDLDHNICL